ncbi:MAG TPA: oligosaccharide flippase family protein [Candidatus Limnocylindrales bacterium]|nr:oligosaccharide flippase family protein [Candidatus Limnocylindrales bacterium]
MAASALGPALFGVWTLMAIVINYANVLTLGVANGAGRDIPYLLGAGEPARAHRIEDAAFTGTLAGAAVAALLALAVGPSLMPDAVTDQGLVVLLLALAVFLQQLFLLQQILFRSTFRFKQASIQLAILGIAVVVVGVPLLTLGLVGMILAQAFTCALSLVIAARLLGRRPHLSVDLDLARTLISVGFPIMSAGLLFGILTTADRWVVATLLGIVEVGYYGLVGVAISGLLLLPTILGQQFYPRMAFAFGQRAGGAALYALARTQCIAAGALTGAAVVPVAVAGWVGIPLVLPRYTPAVVPLVIVLLGLVVFAFGTGYGNLLNTVGAHRRYLGIQAVSLTVNVISSVSFVRAGLGLPGVALGTSVGMVVYSVLLQLSARWAVRHLVPVPTGAS